MSGIPRAQIRCVGEIYVFTWYRRAWISNGQRRQSYGHVVIQDRPFFFFFLAAKGKEADIIRSTFRPFFPFFIIYPLKFDAYIYFFLRSQFVSSGGRKCAKKKEKSLCQQQQQHTGPVPSSNLYSVSWLTSRDLVIHDRTWMCVGVCARLIFWPPPPPPIVFVIYVHENKKKFPVSTSPIKIKSSGAALSCWHASF